MTKENFKEVFDRYFDSVRSYIYYRCGDTELATDIAQDAFIKIWEKNLPFDLKQNKGLLYKIAGDLFVSHFRRQKLARRYEREISLDLISEETSNLIQYRELKRIYEKALSRLPEKQRIVFLMSRQEGLKYTEIAERLGLSVKAVEKRMNLALTYLKKVVKV